MTNKEIYDLTKYLFESWERGADYDNYHMDCQYVLEGLVKPEQEPVIWTKTWFEDGKVVTQHLTAKDIYKEPEQKLVSHAVIAGALFDFMGYLTSLKKRIVLSASDDASPAVDAIRDFATKRGLSLDDAQVREWIDALAPTSTTCEVQPEQEPVVIHQFRSPHCADWYDGIPDHHDGHGPYEVRTLYTTPPKENT